MSAPPRRPVERTPAISNALLGTLIFVMTEIMFFTGLISAYLVIKSNSMMWTPPTGVTLPIRITALNTAVLFASGIFLHVARKKYLKQDLKATAHHLILATVLATCFVLIQGSEWTQLIGLGMTMENSLFGACFFLLIGSHGLHAISGVIVMVALYYSLVKKTINADVFAAAQVFWFFVVGIWPVLYRLVYF